jgi:hypothetical protein
MGGHTVNSDRNALGQDESISTLEGRDLSESVELGVIGTDALGRLFVDELDIETVGLCHHQQGSGARVVLYDQSSAFSCVAGKQFHSAHRVGIDLSEGHLEVWMG